MIPGPVWIASFISKKDFKKEKEKKQGHLAQAMSMMEQRSGVVSTCPSRQHIAAMHFGVSNQKTWEKSNMLKTWSI